MSVYFENATAQSLDEATIGAVTRQLLAAVGESSSSVSLSFVDDATIRDLNRDHRGKDSATDVLSFPLYEAATFEREPTRPRERGGDAERMLGDIVVSVETAARQAADYDAPLTREIERLLIHSVLHLCGHDHLEPGERAVMEREERRLAAAIGMPWPYDAPA